MIHLMSKYIPNEVNATTPIAIKAITAITTQTAKDTPRINHFHFVSSFIWIPPYPKNWPVALV
jgi:hypothetical protein